MFLFSRYFGAVAGLGYAITFIIYGRAIIKGNARPNRATLWIWASLAGVIFVSLYSMGERWIIWIPLVATVGQTIISVVFFKHSVGGWSSLDRFCLIGSLIAWLIWGVYQAPLVSLLCSLAMDTLGAVPTVKKAYSDPNTEDWQSWSVRVISNLCNVFAVEQLRFAAIVCPLYMFITSGVIVAPLLRARLSLFN